MNQAVVAGPDLGWRSDEQDIPLVDERHSVRDAERQVAIMGHHHDGDTLPLL